VRIEYFAYMLLALLTGSIFLGVISKLKGGAFLPEPTEEEDRYILDERGRVEKAFGPRPIRGGGHGLPHPADSWNFMGTGTMLCARNNRVDETKPHIVTKWITITYFRFWPLATFNVQAVDTAGLGIPGVGGQLKTRYRVLDVLSWRDNKLHILRSLIVGWGVVVALLVSSVK